MSQTKVAIRKGGNTALGTEMLASNRAAYGMSALKICTFFRCQEDNKTAMAAEFRPVTSGEAGNRFLSNNDMSAAGRYPFSLDFTRRLIRIRDSARAMVSGEERYPEGEVALDFLLLRNGDPP